MECLWLRITPFHCHCFIYRKQAAEESRQLQNFSTKMKVVKFLLNTAWLSMIKRVWILGAVAHRSTIVPISGLNILRSDCNSDTSRWRSQKWDMAVLTWTRCWENSMVVGFHFLWSYLWCVFRNWNLVEQWGQSCIHKHKIKRKHSSGVSIS